MATAWLTVLCFVLTATSKALGSVTLKVTTVLAEPFARYTSLTALQHELEGFVLDMLHEMESDPDMANIRFFVTPVEDGKYGSLVSGRWDGMIRKLRDGTADLAAAALSATLSRSTAVTFLSPAFMTYDLAMLMKKGSNVSAAVRSFDDINIEGMTKYKFGVVAGGSTANYLRISRYYYLWAKVSEDGFVQKLEDGVRRVRESNDSHPYIVIGEKPMLDYHASQQPCDLIVVNGNATEYDRRLRRPGEYHLAVRRDIRRDIKNKLEAALGKLNATGRLDDLYNRWWIERSQCYVPTTPEATTTGASITEAATTGAPATEAATTKATTTVAAVPQASASAVPIAQEPASYE